MKKLITAKKLAERLPISTTTMIKHLRNANIINNLLSAEDLQDLQYHYVILSSQSRNANRYIRMSQTIEKILQEVA